MTKYLLTPENFSTTVSLRAVFVGLIFTFSLTHFWILLSFNALYWDDWSLLTSVPFYVSKLFQFTGFDLLGTFHVWFAPFGVGAYKILTLVCIGFTSAFVFLVVRNYDPSTLQAGCVTALFIVAPLNTAKIAAINVPGTLFATVFFLAWVLLLRDLRRPSLLQRLCVLALFSVAFYFPSSLAFFALPAMSIAWHAFRSNDNWSQRLGMLLRRADFLALPFIQFAIFRLFFFKPHASISNEYQRFGIRSSRLQEAVDRFQTDFLLDMPWAVKIVLVALPFLILLRFIKRPPVQEIQTLRRADIWMFSGLSACFFALLPYLAVGRLPVFSDWNSRYHLFLPLGFALICWSMSRYIAAYTQRKWLGICTYALILVLSAGFSVRSYFEYADDWRKQRQLLMELRKIPFINPSSNIVFVDSVSYAKRRILRYNEYTQMMMRSQPGWHGIALSSTQLKSEGAGSLKKYIDNLGGFENIQADPRLFSLSSQWRWSDTCVILTISELNGLVQVTRTEELNTVIQPCLITP